MSLVHVCFRLVSRPNYGIACRTMAYVSIPEFYKGRSLLITGCTGFLGQGLVEKLLRSCPEIGNIYVSIKPNKHGNTEERYQQFIKYKVFDRLRKKEPDFARKIIAFDGDLTKPNLGIINDKLHARMTEDVSVVVHCAALIKLNPSLRESIEANILAARNVVHFGNRCKQLCAYVHVSTMFSNMHLDHQKEEIYPANKTPDEIINLLQSHSDAELTRIEKELIKPTPMVYIFCKHAAESIFLPESLTAPTAVFRSPFITPAMHEPFPVWTYGYGGYIGILHNVCKGTVRHVAGNPDTSVEILPVDDVVNSLIRTGWYLGTGRHKDGGPLVVHTHSSADNPVFLKEIEGAVHDEYISKNSKTFRKLKVVSNRLEHFILWSTLYVLPAFGKDVLLKLRGRNTTHLDTEFRFRKGLKYLEMSTFHNPTKDFNNANMIHKCLQEQDKQDFPFDVKSIHWKEYLRKWLKMERAKQIQRE